MTNRGSSPRIDNKSYFSPFDRARLCFTDASLAISILSNRRTISLLSFDPFIIESIPYLVFSPPLFLQADVDGLQLLYSEFIRLFYDCLIWILSFQIVFYYL